MSCGRTPQETEEVGGKNLELSYQTKVEGRENVFIGCIKSALGTFVEIREWRLRKGSLWRRVDISQA